MSVKIYYVLKSKSESGNEKSDTFLIPKVNPEEISTRSNLVELLRQDGIDQSRIDAVYFTDKPDKPENDYEELTGKNENKLKEWDTIYLRVIMKSDDELINELNAEIEKLKKQSQI